jgi:hypothetical protein
MCVSANILEKSIGYVHVGGQNCSKCFTYGLLDKGLTLAGHVQEMAIQTLGSAIKY